MSVDLFSLETIAANWTRIGIVAAGRSVQLLRTRYLDREFDKRYLILQETRGLLLDAYPCFLTEQLYEQVCELGRVPPFDETLRDAGPIEPSAVRVPRNQQNNRKGSGYFRLRPQHLGEFIAVEGRHGFIEHGECGLLLEDFVHDVYGGIYDERLVTHAFDRRANGVNARVVFTSQHNFRHNSTPLNVSCIAASPAIHSLYYTWETRSLDFMDHQCLNLIHYHSYDFPFKRSRRDPLDASGDPWGNSLRSKITALPSVLILAILLHVSPSWAQEDNADPKSEEPADEEQAAPPVYEGDVLYLKSGKVMSGFQIYRNTPLFFELRYQEGLEPLMIPRKQVERVVFDDIDPARDRLRARLLPPTEEVSLASGERVSRYLMEKLRSPASDEALTYKRIDLVVILEEMAERMQVNLKIHPSVKNRPPNQRLWTLNTTPETTLMALLREDFVGQFKYATVLFEYDTIVVLTKEAAKNRKAIEAEKGQ